MKMLDKLQDRARQRFGFCGSLIIHLLAFLLISFSGGFMTRTQSSDFTEVMFYEGTGGGGGGGGGSEDGVGVGDPDAKDATVEEAEAEAAAAQQAEEPTDAIVEDTSAQEKPAEAPKPKPQPKPASDKTGEGQNRGKGSGTGTGGGHGSGHGTGVGSGTGPGSGSGGGHGSGHGTGIGSGIGPGRGVYLQPAVPPKIVQTVPPYYPPAQKEAGIEGLSVLRLVIGTGGQVEHAEVIKSSGSEALDNSALNAAKKWRFTPAKDKAGHKVRCYFNLPIRFSIQYG